MRVRPSLVLLVALVAGGCKESGAADGGTSDLTAGVIGRMMLLDVIGTQYVPDVTDPSKEVAWGNLTSEEMVLPWFGVIVDKNADPERVLSIRQDGCGITDGVVTPTPVRAPTRSVPFPIRRN